MAEYLRYSLCYTVITMVNYLHPSNAPINVMPAEGGGGGGGGRA